MGYLGEEIKKLGFGMMRLPNENGKIDIETTSKMVDMFMDAGFTYFDTAFVYQGSEDAVRRSLVERHPRGSFQLASKIAPWVNCTSKEDAVNQLTTSLKRTGAEYFDFYLLHNLGGERTQIVDKFDLWNWSVGMKEKGYVRHIGFSFHSTAEELDKILTDHPEMEFVQLQINYMDWNSLSIQSQACYEVARKHNKPIIIMEPVKGGLLADPPQMIYDIFRSAEPQSSAASWAIRYAADLEGVITVLSGMSTPNQVDDNVSCMKEFNGLTDEQRDVIFRVQEEFNKVPQIPCTDCNYCAKVCPKNIGISDSFAAYNIFAKYNNAQKAIKHLNNSLGFSGMAKPENCIKCGKCEQVCPQHISIREELTKVCDALK